MPRRRRRRRKHSLPARSPHRRSKLTPTTSTATDAPPTPRRVRMRQQPPSRHRRRPESRGSRRHHRERREATLDATDPSDTTDGKERPPSGSMENGQSTVRRPTTGAKAEAASGTTRKEGTYTGSPAANPRPHDPSTPEEPTEYTSIGYVRGATEYKLGTMQIWIEEDNYNRGVRVMAHGDKVVIGGGQAGTGGVLPSNLHEGPGGGHEIGDG